MKPVQIKSVLRQNGSCTEPQLPDIALYGLAAFFSPRLVHYTIMFEPNQAEWYFIVQLRKWLQWVFKKTQIECLRQRVPMHQLYDLQHSSPVFLLSVSFHDHSSAERRSFWPLNTNTSCVFSGLWHSSSTPFCFTLSKFGFICPLWGSFYTLFCSDQIQSIYYALFLLKTGSRISQTVLTIFSCFLVTVQIHCYAVWLCCYQISWLWQRSSQLLVLVCDVLQKASLECQLFFRASKSQS